MKTTNNKLSKLFFYLSFVVLCAALIFKFVVAPLQNTSQEPEDPLENSRKLLMAEFKSAVETSSYEKMLPLLQEAKSLFSDYQLLDCSAQVLRKLQQDQQRDIAEEYARYLAFDLQDKKRSTSLGARIWIEIGMVNNLASLPERLRQLMHTTLTPDQVGELLERYFYEVSHNQELLQQLNTLGEQIIAQCKDQRLSDEIKVRIIDGAFLSNNFSQALRMLETRVTSRDESWHEKSIAKVKAHQALAENKQRDAVMYFREFMNACLTSESLFEHDPASGIAYSTEWILGRNALRIADILASIPDNAMADEARQEAIGYFKVALQKAASQPEALKLLQEEIKPLGIKIQE